MKNFWLLMVHLRVMIEVCANYRVSYYPLLLTLHGYFFTAITSQYFCSFSA
jgi:hypothetical protein